ncbi:MAG: CocE/NonD family hydrolase [Bacteroidetes bacterium]|nr:CocE/NonD family hydrolase [Bacteroidota bacterium]
MATGEYFNSTLQNNGVFRRELMAGWIEYQMQQVIKTNPADDDLQNNIHSNFDFGLIPSADIIDKAIDQYSVIKGKNGFAAMYPNYANRNDMDIGFSMVNNLGESDANGQFSRYSNMELPIYHLTGWWDIFIDGQISTYNNIIKNTGVKTKSNQKLVIGPWTHGTIGKDSVTDQVFPKSVFDLRIMGNLANSEDKLSEVFKGEVAAWLRYLLNYNPENFLGEPKVLIPESNLWQNLGAYDVRIPSKDYYITYADFMNFISGHKGLSAIQAEIKQGSNTMFYSIDVPADESNQAAGSQPFSNPVVPDINFAQVPNVRFYIPGPVNDGIAKNESEGNYWAGSDEFPLTKNVEDHTLFLHSNGSLNSNIPTLSEPPQNYEHNPDDPVITVGGGNLAILTPSKDRLSAGPMNYADPGLATLTMDRADVLQFETAALQSPLTIAGIPKAKIFVSSTPESTSSGETDTDFFVRILDVYPDGKEFFVVEGAVNARARDYVRSLALGNENINLPYSNINIGQTYELEFNLLPIAYCFGYEHKIKVLISSSNWPRYQSNPNLPMGNGEFFRREPKDGKSYSFNGIIMFPRKATQNLYFSPNEPSQIILPKFNGTPLAFEENEKIIDDFILDVFPNPTADLLHIQLNKSGNYNCFLYNIMGQEMLSVKINDSSQSKINLQDFPKGVYVIFVVNQKQQKAIRKVLVF